MKRSSWIKIIVTIIIVLLLPLFSYTAFQVVQSDKNERLITTIYNRQLESILFSINQYCWDIFGLWQSYLTGLLSVPGQEMPGVSIENSLKGFVNNRTPIIAAFIKYPDADFVLAEKDTTRQNHKTVLRSKIITELQTIIADSSAKIDMLHRYAGEGYIRPMVVTRDHSASPATYSYLIFPISLELNSQLRVLGGILVDEQMFVNDVVARKLDDVSGSDFVGAVVRSSDNSLLYGPKGQAGESFEQSKKLWLFPNLDLRIKLNGITLAQVTKGRTRTNLVFLIMVNLVLISGIVFLARNIGQEMKLAQLKTDFVANVSHELRTPLALIRMFAETLELGRVKSDDKKHYYYRTIVNETTRLTRLINNILDFSRIESGRKEYQFVPTDLAELVRQTLETYQFHLEGKGFQLHSKIEATIPEITLDREAINQMLVNLIDNAVKFSSTKKKIIVALYQEASRIILSVQDFGIGIPDSEQTKIFEKFYRIESSLVHNTKGSGLGLALVKHIMDAHNGQVQVKSKLGEGSTFSLIFPLK